MSTGAAVSLAMKYPPSLVPSSGGAALPTTFSLIATNAAQIDPQGGVGGNGSGWVAIVTVFGVTSLVGVAIPSNLTLTVSDPGYTAAGALTTVIRTINGVAHLRRSYPNGDSKIISTNGIDVTLYISLDDWIYSGTTIISASISSAFYPGTITGIATSKVNSSTRAYTKPLFGWVVPQQLSSGATFDVEAVAFHRYARAGRQVACIEFSATDGTNTTASVFKAATQLSTNVKQGNIPEVYAATLDVSGLTNSVICTTNAKVYPWIGDASAILNLTTDGVAWPTTLPQTKLRFLCDRTGAHGGAYAYVSIGAIGGVVSAVPAVARATPFPTFTAALTAIQTWNNVNKGHNDVSGSFIRLMDSSGAPASHGVDSTSANSGLTWCTVELDPLNSAQIKVFFNGLAQLPSLMRWRGAITVDAAASGSFLFVGQNVDRDMLCVDGITIDNTAAKSPMIWYTSYYILNMTVSGGDFDMGSNSSPLTSIALGAGNQQTSAGYWFDFSQKVMVGSVIPSYEVTQEGKATADGDNGRIIYNNAIKSANVNNSSAITLATGFANVQNQYVIVAVGGALCMNYFADGDLTTIFNYIEMHNTAVGERCSRLYNDGPSHGIAPYGVEKYGTSRYSIWDNYNIKCDTLSGGIGAPGNWAYTYSVYNLGNVDLFGTVSRSPGSYPVSSNDGGEGGYFGNAWLPSSMPNIGYPTTPNSGVMALFTDYRVQPQAVPAAGGNYRPLSTSVVFKNRVAAGMSVLKYDLSGALRKTDGTGAAGAYEM